MSVLWKLTRNRYSQFARAKLNQAGFIRMSLLLYRLDLEDWKPGEGPEVIDGPVPYKIDSYLGAIVASRLSDGETVGYMHYTSGMVYVPEVEKKMLMDGQYIYRVLTDPQMRRRGVGKNLMQRTINEIVKENEGKARYVFAIIAVDNLPSRKLFEGAGFLPIKKLQYTRMGDREFYGEKEISVQGESSGNGA